MQVELSTRLKLQDRSIGSVDVVLRFEHPGGALDPTAVAAAVGRALAGRDGASLQAAASPTDSEAPLGGMDSTAVKDFRSTALPETTASVQRLIGQEWKPPTDLHGKQVRTVHRMVKAVEEITRHGKGATAQEIADKGRIALPTVYNTMKDDSPAAAYMNRVFLFTKMGRTRVVDLTKEGRYLASLIRAGKIPA